MAILVFSPAYFPNKTPLRRPLYPQQQQPLPPSSPASSLPTHSSQQQWSFLDSEEVIQCFCCKRDGYPGNMFLANFAIANHIVNDHNNLTSVPTVNVHYLTRTGCLLTMEQGLPCLGCPFSQARVPARVTDPPDTGEY